MTPSPTSTHAEAQGTRVPRIGLGTWQITGRACRRAVRDALDQGYRHIDTAAGYGNEEDVGRGIDASDVPREDVWLTTKIGPGDAAADRLRRAAEGSLGRLATEYVDLLLLHWPNPGVPVGETISELTRLREEGKARAIGVSNFTARLLGEALRYGDLLCDQVEYHVCLGQDALLEMAERHDMLIAAYSPLGHRRILGERALREIGRARGKSAAQVALRWLIEQPRVCALPKASARRRRAANLAVFDFELSEGERRRIATLPKDRRVIDPPWAPDWAAG